MFRTSIVFVSCLLFSSLAIADDYYGHHHGHHGRHGHHRDHYVEYYRPVEPVYYREEVQYYPEREVRYEPAPRYERYDNYDRRSPQGLLGGALGSVMGYQMGGGDPLAAGFGAAAGSWLGNEMNR